MFYKSIIAFLLFITPAFGGINVESEYVEHDPIVITCDVDGVSPKDIIYEWELKPTQKNQPNVKYLRLNNNQCLHIWGKPGEYEVECTTIVQHKKQVTILVRDKNNPDDISKATMTDIWVVDKIDVSKDTKIFVVKKDSPTPEPGPTPEPEPEPTPNPEPEPEPVVENDPIEAEGFRVLIVEDTKNRIRLDKEQIYALQTSDIQTYVKKNGGFFRQYDDNLTLQNDSEDWKQPYFRPRTSLPWIIVSNDKNWYEGPLPKTKEETLTLVEKYKPR